MDQVCVHIQGVLPQFSIKKDIQVDLAIKLGDKLKRLYKN